MLNVLIRQTYYDENSMKESDNAIMNTQRIIKYINTDSSTHYSDKSMMTSQLINLASQ